MFIRIYKFNTGCIESREWSSVYEAKRWQFYIIFGSHIWPTSTCNNSTKCHFICGRQRRCCSFRFCSRPFALGVNVRAQLAQNCLCRRRRTAAQPDRVFVRVVIVRLIIILSGSMGSIFGSQKFRTTTNEWTWTRWRQPRAVNRRKSVQIAVRAHLQIHIHIFHININVIHSGRHAERFTFSTN